MKNSVRTCFRNKTKEKIYTGDNHLPASLTVEAALVLPIFLFFMMAFLYFIQIFIIQEQLQAAMTKMGLCLAKTSYVYQDFVSPQEACDFDETIFDKNYDIGLYSLACSVTNGAALNLYLKHYLKEEIVDNSCIQNGMEGIDFSSSRIYDMDHCIDIIARYNVITPFSLFGMNHMKMIQRVKLRSWTGYQVEAKYSVSEEDNSSDPIVYITKTGSVYHTNRSCSFINLSVTQVAGIPTGLRNENGGKYYPCEYCCKGNLSDKEMYYITSNGERYHIDRNCPKIKRDVKEVHLSEVKDRRECSRCRKRH